MADLKDEIAFLLGQNNKGNLRATVRVAVKANWRTRRLKRLEKDLADSEQVMQSALLAWILYVILPSALYDLSKTATLHGIIPYQRNKGLATAVFPVGLLLIDAW